MTEVFRWKLQGNLISKFSGQKTWVASVSRVPHVPRSVFSMPLKPPSVALGRSKIAFTRQTGQARDLQSNLSSMAPRSQGCKRCSGVDTVRQLFFCLDILSVGTQFYWKQFPGWKTSWIEIQSEGDILFIFRNCLLPQKHVLEYPSLTPYRDGYMRYSINQVFQDFEMSLPLHPNFQLWKDRPCWHLSVGCAPSVVEPWNCCLGCRVLGPIWSATHESWWWPLSHQNSKHISNMSFW